MNELKDLINKKRKINETIRNSIVSSSNNKNNNSCVLMSANSTDGDDVVDRDSGIDKKKTMKFIRQADLRKMEEMELMRKQEELDLLRAQRQQQQQLNSNHHDGSVDGMKSDYVTTTTMMNNSSSKHNIASIVSKNSINLDDLSSYTLLSTSEVKMKLRRLRQPITLFGEEIEQRLQRLVEFIREGILMSGSSHGFDEVDGYDGDDIKTGLNRLETEHEEAELDAQDREDARDKGAEQGGDDNHDDDDEDDDDLKDGSGRDQHSSRLEWDPSVHYSTLKHLTPEKVVYKFFRALIKQWEVDLHQLRDDAEKRSAKGTRFLLIIIVVVEYQLCAPSPSIYSNIHPFIHPYIYSSFYLPYPSVYSSIQTFIYPTHLYHLFIYLFIYPFINSFID